MAISNSTKRRDALTGRWPAPGFQSPGRRAKPARKPRRAKAGGLARRSTANTKRGAKGGSMTSTRGHKRVLESRKHGGPYGTTAQAYPQTLWG